MKRESVENILRKIVVPVGNAVEGIIGKAKKAKESMSQAGHTSLQPILALESQIPLPKLKDIILRSTTRIVEQYIPVVQGKPTLEVSEGQATFLRLLKDRGGKQVIHIDIGTSSFGSESLHRIVGTYELRSNARKFPFEDNFFGICIAVLTTPLQGEFLKAVKEIGRVVSPGGDAIFTDFHPFGLYAKKGNVRLKPRESSIRGFEDYYKICKVAGFKIYDIKEVFIDESMRSLFASQEEKSAFKNLKDTPLVLCLFAKKVE